MVRMNKEIYKDLVVSYCHENGRSEIYGTVEHGCGIDLEKTYVKS